MRNIYLLMCVGTFGCAAVPTQLQEAVTTQQTEIENVKALYATNVGNLLDAVESYRLEILDLYEAQYMARYSKALDEIDGTVQEVDPTGDPDVDFIHLSTLQQIRDFFDTQRSEVHADIQSRREQYALIENNFENIEAINAALGDYLASLARLKNSRDAAAMGLIRRVGSLSSFPISLSALPDPTTIEQLIEQTIPALGGTQ